MIAPVASAQFETLNVTRRQGVVAGAVLATLESTDI